MAMATSEFHSTKAVGNTKVKLDVTALADGYVAVAANSSQRLKFQVKTGTVTYNYDMPSNGTPAVFPLQCGNGSYTFRVMEGTASGKYTELFSKTDNVALKDEYAPFIRPNNFVSYTQASACVKKAAELAVAGDPAKTVDAVCAFLQDTLTYDYAKASSVTSGYLPSPDTTLQNRKGICADYASLLAAMLRSQGIPVKMIYGTISPTNQYHAWNMVYRDKKWQRVDLTAEPGQTVRQGTTYADDKVY